MLVNSQGTYLGGATYANQDILGPNSPNFLYVWPVLTASTTQEPGPYFIPGTVSETSVWEYDAETGELHLVWTNPDGSTVTGDIYQWTDEQQESTAIFTPDIDAMMATNPGTYMLLRTYAAGGGVCGVIESPHSHEPNSTRPATIPPLVNNGISKLLYSLFMKKLLALTETYTPNLLGMVSSGLGEADAYGLAASLRRQMDDRTMLRQVTVIKYSIIWFVTETYPAYCRPRQNDSPVVRKVGLDPHK
ncbi:hypothetical protein FRB99_000114 [Tulasnella sp. 403]|nr:hypothetical protein FRB99_000114 [Tulasnella sp. 403]